MLYGDDMTSDQPRMPSREEVESKLRERAAAEGRPIDTVDAFLINMSKVIGVDATDRYLGRPGA